MRFDELTPILIVPDMSLPSTSHSAFRLFSTTSSRLAAAPLSAAVAAARRKTERVKRIPRLKDLQTFQFDEPTSLGWMRLEAIKEAQDLARKVEVNDKVLRGELAGSQNPLRRNQTEVLGIQG